jgi:thymidylate synthase (FAD)
MNVRLLSYSQPTAEFASQGIADAQELIAYCARVSNPSNQFNTDTSENLSGILFDTSTGVPLKWSVLAWKLRQQEILRGKSSGTEVSAFQEFSQRYADPTKDLEFVLREARLQDPKNRQNSIELMCKTILQARNLARGLGTCSTTCKTCSH